MRSLAEARALADHAREAFTAAGLDVTVTTDPAKVAPVVAANGVALVVNPPELTFTTWTDTDVEWSLWLVAGPRNDPDTAWAQLDAALDAIREPLELDRARPDAFRDNHGATYPAFVLTTTTTYQE